jgi:hypothetical protein
MGYMSHTLKMSFLTMTFDPQITGVPQESLVTMVKPGLPTTAELYILPPESKPAKRSVFVDKVHYQTDTLPNSLALLDSFILVEIELCEF